MEKQPSKIIDKILEFINSYDNPDDAKGDYRPLKLYHLNVYDVSYDFAFKWYIKKEEFEEIAKFIDEDISDNKKNLFLSFGQYQVELEIKEEIKEKEN